jgi:hypothetical protein
MSIDVFVFSDRRLMSISEWQRSIDSERFGILLSDGTSIEELHGYLPVHRSGIRTGFECTNCNAAEIMSLYKSIEFGRTWTQCLRFTWSSDFEEGLAASMASAAYAKVANGIVFDPQDSIIMSSQEATSVPDAWKLSFRNGSEWWQILRGNFPRGGRSRAA